MLENKKFYKGVNFKKMPIESPIDINWWNEEVRNFLNEIFKIFLMKLYSTTGNYFVSIQWCHKCEFCHGFKKSLR